MSKTKQLFHDVCESHAYIKKFFGGCIIIMIVVFIILGAFIGISGSAEAKVEMRGDQDEALIQQIWVSICLRSMVLIWVQNSAMVGLELNISTWC